MFTVGAAADAAPKIEALVVFMTLIAWWAMMRPSMIRDYNQRRLPSNPTARFLYGIICLLTYLALVVFFQAFGEMARKISAAVLPMFVRNFVDTFKDTAPLLGAVSMGALLQFSFVRDIERSVLVWLHSARHLHGDSVLLAKHLGRCKFTPDDDERDKNRETARSYGVYVFGEDFDGVGLITFHNWRKVASLLRLVREWNLPESGLLAENDMTALSEIESAHERKTQLAMAIIKMVGQVERSGKTSTALTELIAMLSTTGHTNRVDVSEFESRVNSLLGGAAGIAAAPADRPLRLSSEAFHGYLEQIEGYFKVEYDILLNQVADFAARSVVLSGADAPERLQRLKSVGFDGLGRIEPINFDRILWLFLVVAFGSFLVMYLGNIGNATAPPSDSMARFSFVMAIAALIGAIVGSSRSLARAAATPWGIYFAAGLAAAIVHLTVNEVWELARTYMSATTVPEAVAAQPPQNLVQAPRSTVGMLPWTILSFMVTTAVCRLGRLERWPGLVKNDGWSKLAERGLDGLVVSGAVLIGFYLALGALDLFGLPIPKAVQALMERPHVLPVPVPVPLQVIGFVIGFFTVRDVRRAAHANMIDVSPAAALKPQPTVLSVKETSVSLTPRPL